MGIWIGGGIGPVRVGTHIGGRRRSRGPSGLAIIAAVIGGLLALTVVWYALAWPFSAWPHNLALAWLVEILWLALLGSGVCLMWRDRRNKQAAHRRRAADASAEQYRLAAEAEQRRQETVAWLARVEAEAAEQRQLAAAAEAERRQAAEAEEGQRIQLHRQMGVPFWARGAWTHGRCTIQHRSEGAAARCRSTA